MAVLVHFHAHIVFMLGHNLSLESFITVSPLTVNTAFFLPEGLDSQYNTISSLGPFADETGCISENIIVKKSVLTST